MAHTIVTWALTGGTNTADCGLPWLIDKTNATSTFHERSVSLELALGAVGRRDHEKRITMEFPVGKARGPRLRVE